MVHLTQVLMVSQNEARMYLLFRSQEKAKLAGCSVCADAQVYTFMSNI